MRGFWKLLAWSIAISILITPGTVSAAPVGARSAALADAFVGLADGLEGAFWNPAGLVWLERPELGAALSVFESQTEHPSHFIGYATPPEDLGAGAVWWRRDVTPLPGDGFLTADSLAYSYGMKITPTFSAGGTIRMQSEQITATGYTLSEWSGYGLDLGVLWKANPRLSAGIAFKDVTGTPLTSDSELTTETPLGVQAGCAYRLNPKTVITLDLTDALDNSLAGTGVAGGVEFAVSPLVQLRAGAAAAGDSRKLTAGIGYRTTRLRADLAVVDTDDAVQTVVGLAYLF